MMDKVGKLNTATFNWVIVFHRERQVLYLPRSVFFFIDNAGICVLNTCVHVQIY